jgi:hypothetical protein
MAYIGPIPAETFTSFATQEFSTSATTSYTLDHPVTNENELALFVNNVRQQPGSGKAYTASGTALTLSAATASTDTMYAVFLGRALQTVNPADASVGTSQLAATSVTAAKFNADVISGQTALAATPADTDEFLISDAGVLKRLDYSYIKASSGLVHIKTLTASNSSSLDFSNGSSNVVLDSTYSRYVFYIDVQLASDNVQLQFLYSDDAGSSYLDANYAYGMIGRSGGGSTVTRNNSNDGQIELFPETIGQDTDETFALTLNLSQPAQTDSHKTCFWNGGGFNTSASLFGYTGGGINYSTVNAITGVRFKASSGNIERGTISMFGVSIS